MSENNLVVRDVLRLVATPDAIIVTRRLADRMGLDEGDSLRVRSLHGEFSLRIRGILEPGGLGVEVASEAYSRSFSTGAIAKSTISCGRGCSDQLRTKITGLMIGTRSGCMDRWIV